MRITVVICALLLAACNDSNDANLDPVSVSASETPQPQIATLPPPVATPTPAMSSPSATIDCTMQSGSFQMVATGFASDTVGTATYKYYPCDKLAHIFLPPISGTSNAASFTASPLPDFLIPATIPHQEHAVNGFDQGVEQSVIAVFLEAGSNVLTYARNGDTTGWTPNSTKGVGLQVITVFLD